MIPISMATQIYRTTVFLKTAVGKAQRNKKQCEELENRVDAIVSLLKSASTDLEKSQVAKSLNNLHACIEQCLEFVKSFQDEMPWYYQIFSSPNSTEQFEHWNRKLSHCIDDLQLSITLRSSFDTKEDPVEAGDFVKEEYSFICIPYDDLIQEQLIGRGGFADVYRGTWRSQDKEVAIKILRIQHIDAEARKDFLNEISTMCKVRHDHILNIFGASLEADRYALIVEYMSLGSLYDVLRKQTVKLTWADRWLIAWQMINGINYLHSLPKPIIHRDIKSLNVLMNKQDHELIVKVADFGLAKIRHETSSRSSHHVSVGTLAWKAPELLEMGKNTEASDVYALGVVLWELATGDVPYEDHDESTIRAFVREGDRLKIPTNTPLSFVGLISSAWVHEPKARSTCQQLLNLLKDNSCDSGTLTHTQFPQKASDTCSGELPTLSRSNTSASSSLCSEVHNTSNFSTESKASRLKRYSCLKTKRMSNVSLTASKLIDIWRRYDEDGNGFISGENVEEFLGKVAKTIGQTLDSLLLQSSILQALVDRCSEEENITIGLEEFTALLPTEDKFLLLFRKNNRLNSTVDFIRAWKRFDLDRNGFIEAGELSGFIREIMNNKLESSENTIQEITDEQIAKYSTLILRVFDSNGDGFLQLSEMIKLTPVKTHGLLRRISKRGSFTARDIDSFFDYYDQDKDGLLKEEEFEGLVYDILTLSEKEIDFHMLEELKQILTNTFAETDGQLTKAELCEIMTIICKKDKEISEN